MPLVPRFHLFEIDDQPWFPPFLRARVQDALLEAWTTRVPLLQHISPAHLASSILHDTLGPALISSFTFIDFCAGAGGPTPSIERFLNRRLESASLPTVDFVITDLHPNPEAWSRHPKSDNIQYELAPVDASAADRVLLSRYTTAKSGSTTVNGGGERTERKIFRLFNLAFHHFDDPLAKSILKNTLETSDGFAIFELQGRDVDSIFACLLFGAAILVSAPIYAWRWRSWSVIVFTYLVPVLPFVLVFDGLVSSLRVRTVDEVEALMRSSGADCEGWAVRSGSDRHLWPFGYLNWIIATKDDAGGVSTARKTGPRKKMAVG